MNLEAEIQEKFNYLFTTPYNFKIIDSDQDQELKDNVLVAADSQLRLKFIKDRADFFLDVSSIENPGRWINFYNVLGKLKNKGLLVEDFKSINKMSAVATSLKKHIGLIAKNIDISLFR